MADALPGTQLEILRRIRDGIDLTAPPYVPGMIGELGFLHTFQLVVFRKTFEAELTALGRAYLAAADRAANVERASET